MLAIDMHEGAELVRLSVSEAAGRLWGRSRRDILFRLCFENIRLSTICLAMLLIM